MFRVTSGLIAAALWLPILNSAVAHAEDQKPAFLVIAIYTVPLTLFIAAPLVFLLRRKLTLGRCLLTGALLGIVGALTFWSPYSVKSSLWGAPLVLAGLLSSLLFWVIGVWRNRNLTCVGADTRPRLR